MIEFDKVAVLKTFLQTLEDDRHNFSSLLEDAKKEITFYDWCLGIEETYVGLYEAEILGVFLFRIKPSRQEVDEWVWVIVGDLPPIYITCEESPNPVCAVDSYIGAMREWVEAVKNGDALDKVVPVEAEPSIENALMLQNRLEILNKRIVQANKGDLR